MQLLRDAYRFHAAQETFPEFLARNRRAAMLSAAALVILLTFICLAVDPAYFYPRMTNDPLQYFLKGLAFAERGTTAARYAVNLEPFKYVAAPGVLRAPLLFLFSDFDTRLRAIQLTNIVMLALLGLLFAYFFSWGFPNSRRWAAIPLTFALIVINPIWLSNVFQPWADVLYALACCAFLATAMVIVRPEVRGRRLVTLVLTALVFFVIALMIKFTAPALLALPLLLLFGRDRDRAKPNRNLTIVLTAAAVTAVVFFAMVSAPVLRFYGKVGLAYIGQGDLSAMVTNLFALAIPTQMLPSYYGAFATPPLMNELHPAFFVTTRDVIASLVGMLISAVVVLGMVSRRRQLFPEIVYCILPLPILVPIVSSTPRYLMTYQPFIWLFFLGGAAMLGRPFVAKVGARRTAIIGACAAVALVGAAFVLRAQRVSGNFSRGQSPVSLRSATGYIRDVSATFREARVFLERLPRDRTLLVSPTVPGRWTAILGRPYYAPDANLKNVLTTHTLYLLAECGTQEPCQDFAAWDSTQKAGVARFGDFRFVPVFDRQRQFSKVRIYRIEK
jgi:hypothetical protein